MLFIDGQNMYYRCREHFNWPWMHPLLIGQELVAEDEAKHGAGSHVLTGVRYYTGIHDPNRRSRLHGEMQRRLQAYEALGVYTESLQLHYYQGRGMEKGVDVRIAIDLIRLGNKGAFDVATILSEDSDLNEAALDVYALRDYERWIGVENALPWGPNSHTRWLDCVTRRRRIDAQFFAKVEDRNVY